MPFERTGLFAGLSDEDLAELLASGERVATAADSPVFENGDRGDAMYVVLSGEARVDVGGRFHILKAGDFFGEIAVIAPGPRMATVRAVTGLDLLSYPRGPLRALPALPSRGRAVHDAVPRGASS